jgi:hypothetical protein
MINITQIKMIDTSQIKRPSSIAQRIESFNWDAINVELDAYGAAVIGPLLSPDQCKTLINGYDSEELYRSRVVMARHGFGRGEYKYLTYPLPSVIAELREGLYPYLAEIANRWNEATGIDVRYPVEHEAFKARCHEAAQTKPTPLILKYGPGDYNCLHQDIYGEHVFPLSNRVSAVEAQRGIYRRRVHAHRTTPTHAVAGGGCTTWAGNGRHLLRPSQTRERYTRHLSREHATWRQPRSLRPAVHDGRHLP